jgi:hypothetical protein
MSNAATELNTWKNLFGKSSLAPKFLLNKVRELEASQNEYSEQGGPTSKISTGNRSIDCFITADTGIGSTQPHMLGLIESDQNK